MLILAVIAIGPAIGSVVTQGSVFAVFPAAAILTAIGIGAMALAARQVNRAAQAT